MRSRTSIVSIIIGLAAAIWAGHTMRAHAQNVEAEVRLAIETARRTNPGLSVKLDPATGLPTSVKGLVPRPDPAVALGATRNAAGEPSETDVRRAVEAFMAASEIASAFPQRNAQARKEITQIRRDPDIKGQSVAYVTQRVGGIPVFGSSAKYVVNPALAVTDITASYSTVAIDSTVPKISNSDAIDAARSHLREQLSKRARDPGLDRIFTNLDTVPAKAELSIFDPALMRSRGVIAGPLRLTWLVSIDALRVFVDADNRSIVFYYRDHPTIMLRRVYDLSSNDAFPGKKVLDEETRERLDPLPVDAMRAFQNTGTVRDFFYVVLGRNGIEGASSQGGGGQLESYVRYSSEANARWCKEKSVNCPKPNVMVYGPGFAGALDVVGHEVTHGIIAHEADLVYADESGAVNESLADILGTLIEFQAKEGNGNWTIGEGLPGHSEASPMRSLSDPHLSKGPGTSLFNKTQAFSSANRGQPDHYSEYVARADPICDTTWDYLNGCVHFNSGVLNKFAYLIAEGGQHKGVTIAGVGRNKLARITYRSLTTKLNATSGLVHAAEAFVAACSDLAGTGVAGITAQDCVQVEKAQQAVGLAAGS